MRSKSTSALARFRRDWRPREEVEDECRGPGELLLAVALTRKRVVVLPEPLAPGEVHQGAPNLLRLVSVPVALETALEDPVQDRPHGPAPVARRLEAGIRRRQAGHGPAGGSEAYPRACQLLEHALHAPAVGNARVQGREAGSRRDGHSLVRDHVV